MNLFSGCICFLNKSPRVLPPYCSCAHRIKYLFHLSSLLFFQDLVQSHNPHTAFPGFPRSRKLTLFIVRAFCWGHYCPLTSFDLTQVVTSVFLIKVFLCFSVQIMTCFIPASNIAYVGVWYRSFLPLTKYPFNG